MLHQYIPCIPSIPRLCGWFRGKLLKPSRVLITGMPEPSASASSSSNALELTIPCPAMITGRSAWLMSSAALRTFSSVSSDSCGSGTHGVSGYSNSASSSCTSLGTSISTGPGLPSWATRKASRTVRARSLADITKYVLLVHTDAMLQMSHSWNASVPMAARATWPVMATSGTLSALAPMIPVTRLVAPGPDVATQTPGFPVIRA